MTPDKGVDEMRKTIALHFYNANFPEAYSQEEIYKYEKEVDYFMQLLTQYHQDIMGEVLGKLEGMLIPITTQKDLQLLEYKSYNNAITEAQTIIKSPTPPIKSDVR